MCVIMAADTTRPTPQMVAGGFSSNSHGAGIAWRGIDAEGFPVVHWAKGIDDLEIIQKFAAETPLPYILHFRIASIGEKIKQLTHPFLVDPESPCHLQGTTRGSVLFHNGTWNAWRNVFIDCSLRGLWPIPTGPWSDSRAMAILASRLGVGYLDFLSDEKILVFDPAEHPDANGDMCDGINFLGSQRWTCVNDVMCSNSFFLTRHQEPTGEAHEKAQEGTKKVAAPVQPLNESRFDRMRPDDPIDRDSFTQRLSSNRGGSAEIVPFVQKRPKRIRKSSPRFKQAIWRQCKSLPEARRWYAEGIMSKNQYKKALIKLCKVTKQTWESEREKLDPDQVTLH